MPPVQPLLGICPWVWTFCFLGFFWFWLVCPKVTKNKQKQTSSDLCLLSSLSWVSVHGSELFFLLLAGLPKSDQAQKQYKQFRPMSPGQPLLGICPWVWTFFLVLAGLPKSDQKQKNTQQVHTYVSCPASAGYLSMGLNFLFFCFFWFWLVCPKVNKKIIIHFWVTTSSIQI